MQCEAFGEQVRTLSHRGGDGVGECLVAVHGLTGDRDEEFHIAAPVSGGGSSPNGAERIRIILGEVGDRESASEYDLNDFGDELFFCREVVDQGRVADACRLGDFPKGEVVESMFECVFGGRAEYFAAPVLEAPFAAIDLVVHVGQASRWTVQLGLVDHLVELHYLQYVQLFTP